MSKYGLLQGLGQGMASAGDFMMRTKADELKEQRLRQYRMEAEARQNERQDLIRGQDRANQLADTADERAQTKDVMEDVKDDSGTLIGQRNKHTGEFKPFTQKSTSQRPISNGNAVYDPNTGTWSQNPYAAPDGKMSDKDKKTVDALTADIKALRGSDYPDEDKIWQLEQQRNKILGLDADEGGLSPARDRELMAEAKAEAESWAKNQAGLLSRDKTDFKDYGGNRQEAISQKALELYQQKRSAITGSPGGLLAARQDSPPSPATDATADMPDPAQHAGRMIRDDETGKMYKSNGKSWEPL
jgi:hypothetical protein